MQRNTCHVLAKDYGLAGQTVIYCKLNSTVTYFLKIEAAVENKELSRLRLRRTTIVLLFLVDNCRCVYRSWEGFIPGNCGKLKSLKSCRCPGLGPAERQERDFGGHTEAHGGAHGAKTAVHINRGQR